MKSKFTKRIVGLLLALVFMIGFLPNNGINNDVMAAVEYQGYNANGENQSMALYAKELNALLNPDSDELVYCFNATRGVPTTPTIGKELDTIYPNYDKIPGTASNFAGILVKSPIPHNLNAEQLKDAVLKAI